MKSLNRCFLVILFLGMSVAKASEYSCYGSASGHVNITLDEKKLIAVNKIGGTYTYFEKGQRVIPVNAEITCDMYTNAYRKYGKVEMQFHCVDLTAPQDHQDYLESITINLEDLQITMREKRKFKTPEEFIRQGYGTRTIVCNKVN